MTMACMIIIVESTTARYISMPKWAGKQSKKNVERTWLLIVPVSDSYFEKNFCIDNKIRPSSRHRKSACKPSEEQHYHTTFHKVHTNSQLPWIRSRVDLAPNVAICSSSSEPLPWERHLKSWAQLHNTEIGRTRNSWKLPSIGLSISLTW